jgi:hypothetical protein
MFLSNKQFRSGLGAYPDEVWYDPNRPSLLPYWIDDFTETARKYATVLVGNPTAQTSGVTTVVTTQADGKSTTTGDGEPKPPDTTMSLQTMAMILGGGLVLVLALKR